MKIKMNIGKSWNSKNVIFWIRKTKFLYNLYQDYFCANFDKETEIEIARAIKKIFNKYGFFETPEGACVTLVSIIELVRYDLNGFNI